MIRYIPNAKPFRLAAMNCHYIKFPLSYFLDRAEAYGLSLIHICIELFDVYEGSQIKEGFKSVAYSVTFRAKDRTLEEKEITTVMNKILNGLQSMGIELRS